MQYGALLSRAWNIIWRNKVIWVFGFLAALGSSGGGGGNGGGSRTNFEAPGSGQGGGELPPEVQRAITELFANQTLILTIVVAIILAALVIGLLLALISALGHGAMVEMAREADETEHTSFATGWNTGRRRMFPVFLIRFLLGLPPAIIVLAGLAPLLLALMPLITQPGTADVERLFAGGALASMLGCFLPACCIGVLLTIPLSVLEVLAIRALVLEDQGILGGIRRGWGILIGNLGEVAVLWLIFIAIGIGVGIVIGVPMTMIGLVVLLPLVLAVIASPIFLIPLLLVVLVLGLLSVALRGVVEAYTSTVWTLAYRQFAAHSALAPTMA